MSVIDDLQELAIGARMKRLYDTFARDVAQIYRDEELNFEPKYFALYYLISRRGEIGITEIAEELSLTHPGVIHLAKELEKMGYIKSAKSKADSRKRILRLSDKGKDSLGRFEHVWAKITSLNKSLFENQQHHLLDALAGVEEQLNQKNYYQRFKEMFAPTEKSDVTILPYEPKLKKYFKSLNIEWINTYFTVEAHDLEQLDHPEEHILKDGGYIFFAAVDGQIAGTCALIKTGKDEYELAKMGVSPRYQGRKVGQAIMDEAFRLAGQLKVKRLWLGSNSKLAPALAIYRKYGFKDIPVGNTPYKRADVKMEIWL